MESLYKLGFLVSTPFYSSDTILKFWSYFDRTLANNKKTHDGKHRILSIIADNFTYSELQKNLGVSMNVLHSYLAYLEFFFFLMRKKIDTNFIIEIRLVNILYLNLENIEE